jgi:hypothetical protein
MASIDADDLVSLRQCLLLLGDKYSLLNYSKSVAQNGNLSSQGSCLLVERVNEAAAFLHVDKLTRNWLIMSRKRELDIK